MAKFDPLYKLFNYACDKMYRIIYKTNYDDEHAMRGMLLNCHGSFLILLGEKGLYYIKHNDVLLIEPIPMTFKMNEEYRSVIETYLTERAAQE